jgi:hypothetical protein
MKTIYTLLIFIIIPLIIILFILLYFKLKIYDDKEYDDNTTILLTSPDDVKNQPNKLILQSISNNFSEMLCTIILVGEIPVRVCLSDFINAGKEIWDVYVDNIAKMDVINDFGSALPCIMEKCMDGKKKHQVLLM